MGRKVIYLAIALVSLSFVLMSLPALAEDTKSGSDATPICDGKYLFRNPFKEMIDNTPQIKEMQSKPSRPLSFKDDVIGNRIPTQTDNSGKLRTLRA